MCVYACTRVFAYACVCACACVCWGKLMNPSPSISLHNYSTFFKPGRPPAFTQGKPSLGRAGSGDEPSRPAPSPAGALCPPRPISPGHEGPLSSAGPSVPKRMSPSEKVLTPKRGRAPKLEDWLENGHQHSWGLWLLPSASERRGVPAAAMSLPAEPCPATHPQHTPCRAGGGGHGDKDRAPGGRHGACSVTSSLSFSQKPGLQGPEIVCGLHPPLAYRSLRLSPRTTPHRVGGDRNCAFSPYPLALPEKQE